MAPATFGLVQLKSCSHLLVFCANTKTDELIAEISRLMKKGGAPEDLRKMRIDMANGMFKRMTQEEITGWAKCHAYLAMGNAVNGAKSLGFDSCPMAGFDPAGYTRILNLPEHLIPTLLCAIGYAADKPIPKMRFSKEEILI